MQIKAAIVREKGALFEIQNVRLDPPKEHEVLVRIAASGICHTDLSVRDQSKPVPLPAVLGHEGSGIVEKVGEGVTSVEPGDHVVLSASSCGMCKACRAGRPYACSRAYQLNFAGKMPDGSHRLHNGSESVSHFFGQSSFAAYSVVNERNLVKVDKAIPIELLGPLGCGVQTGCGAVFNKLKPPVGSTLAVFGCGTVGLSAVMAARISGCSRIIAVDIHENRLRLATELGATDTVNARDRDPVRAIIDLTNGGVDCSLDTSGQPGVLRQAADCLSMSGTAVLIGGTPLGTQVSLDMNHMLYDRTVTGCIQGNSVPQNFIPQLIEMYGKGWLPFDKLMKMYDFEDLNQAVHDMETGATIKPVLVMPGFQIPPHLE
ncbi:NAD(P)-dependent alcohol dehydrogenase [Ferviditalea candida]|uniref:NAD(P)-dependent alcohol dehydrogenase n=1 Tax=Ferviditalea candida TaxID=3108399 RepID=A0ABU5ZJP6_9BACL|nr:NAD(P)-dependent alcohol dehydrogenase [Paenibacillaceae bacterium T2]